MSMPLLPAPQRQVLTLGLVHTEKPAICGLQFGFSSLAPLPEVLSGFRWCFSALVNGECLHLPSFSPVLWAEVCPVSSTVLRIHKELISLLVQLSCCYDGLKTSRALYMSNGECQKFRNSRCNTKELLKLNSKWVKVCFAHTKDSSWTGNTQTKK